MVDIYHEDPFQQIVNVGWRSGKFAALLFQSAWRNGSHNADNFLVSITPLGSSFHIYDHIDIKSIDRQMILSRGPFRNHTQSGGESASSTETFYHYVVSTTDSFGQGWVRVVETTGPEGTTSGWGEVTDPPEYAPVGISGSGGIGAFGAFKLTQGWTAFGTDITDGPHSGGGTTPLSVSDVDNACVILKLDLISSLLPPGTTHLQFDMTVGNGPSEVHDPDHTGIIGYVWTASLLTFNNASFDLLQTNPANNLPTVLWPAPAHSAAIHSTAVQPTPSKTVRFVVALADLTIEASSP